ncbi:MAG: hypothetical protein NVS1B10_02560 [Candidatus Saccharimonadales bacterium]
MFKKLTSLLILVLILTPSIASAHVAVTPNQVNIGKELVFSISSPNERQSAITKLILKIPDGVTNVVQPGWTITTAANGNEVSAITWTGSQIPSGQRQDFTFSAQVPAKATIINWKAFQTYDDGTTISWDQQPKKTDEATGNSGPYSTTKINDDLTKNNSNSAASTNTLTLIVSLLSMIIAIVALLKPPSK